MNAFIPAQTNKLAMQIMCGMTSFLLCHNQGREWRAAQGLICVRIHEAEHQLRCRLRSLSAFDAGSFISETCECNKSTRGYVRGYVEHLKNKRATAYRCNPLFLWRRGRDSNPRYVAVHLINSDNHIKQ